MKIIISLFFVLVVAFAATTVKAQAKVADDIVISEACLGPAQTVDKAADWQPAIKDEVLRFPFRKRAFVGDQNWMFNSVNLGGNSAIFLGRPTGGDNMFITRIFGVVIKIDESKIPSPMHHVNITYRPVTCADEQTKIVKLLADNGEYGKKERQYSW